MLTARQQGVFRPLVDAAWVKTCARSGVLDPENKSAREKWYRAELMKALGIYTTKEDVAREKFAQLCAHFEQEIGNSCYWTIRAEQSEEVRQIRWWIDQALIRIGGDWRYAQGIIGQMQFPGDCLEDLNIGQLHKVFQALDTHLRRIRIEGAPDWKDEVCALSGRARTQPRRKAA
ncbi:MAG: hypothetical protein V1929_00150 [bacterium]